MTETTSTQDLRRAVVVDTELAEIFGRLAALGRSLDGYTDQLHRLSGSERTSSRFSGQPVWARSLDEAIAAGPSRSYNASLWHVTLEQLYNGRVEVKALADRRDDLQREWVAAGRWSRFFLVRGGHIHASMDCSTCNNGREATEFGWLPTLSGLTEADAVAQEGALLCTVCFPSAPVEWTNGHELAAAAKAAARCPGSGVYVDARGSRYVRCPECSAVISRTPTGKLRAHEPKA